MSKPRSVTGAGLFTVRRQGPLGGTLSAPGDKSITHRALIICALTVGESRIARPLDAADTRALARALQALGARVDWPAGGDAVVHGFGIGGALQPDRPLDLGNSGTAARLLAGVLATSDVQAVLTGDASLSRRPMARVAEPLALMGATLRAHGGRLPLWIEGMPAPAPFAYRLPFPSAQVKSALLLAALTAPGLSRVAEPVPTRDHTERMLLAAGADIRAETVEGAREVVVRGERELRPRNWDVPGDPSSAHFPLLAALLVPNSDVRVTGVLLSPSRARHLQVLREMGADMAVEVTGDWLGDPVATVAARARSLRAVPIAPDPALIDEWPALFVAAAFAHGRTEVRGLSELRAKESDRLAAMAAGLRALGVDAAERPDGLVIDGRAGAPFAGGATLATHGDHRVAMALAVAGLAADAPVTLDDMDCTSTSYPDFTRDMAALGAW